MVSVPAPTQPILVLDDDQDLLTLVRRALEREGHAVVTAKSAAEALSLSADTPPALIIADLMLPHVDGEAFLRRYRQNHPDHMCPVILVTASAQRREVADRMHVQATLEKPFAFEDLCALVHDITLAE